MVSHGEASEKIFSHVLYQLSYLGFLLRRRTPAPKLGRYSERAAPCPGLRPPQRRRRFRPPQVSRRPRHPGGERCPPARCAAASSPSSSAAAFTATGNGVAAAQPARQIDVAAARRAERPERQFRRSPADRAAAAIGGWGTLAGHRRYSTSRRQVGSSSAARTQAKCSGKPSPTSSATTSVSGSPTTLE